MCTVAALRSGRRFGIVPAVRDTGMAGPDTQDRELGVLFFGAAEWRSFVGSAGEDRC